MKDGADSFAGSTGTLAAEIVSTQYCGTYPRDCPKNLPRVVFVGRSNAGKSSLLNAVLGSRKLARVSKQPGRTQLVHVFEVRWRQEGSQGIEECYFLDTPGYGFSRVGHDVQNVWEAQMQTLLEDQPPCALIVVMDARRELESEERWFSKILPLQHILFALTKSDKLGGNERRQREQCLPGDLQEHASWGILCSSHARLGIDELRNRILFKTLSERT